MKLENLKGIIPDNVLEEIPAVITKFNINTPLRLSHFLSQAADESGDFKATSENLNYSSERLLVVFPSHFKNVDMSIYNHNPEKIANRIYADRMGNSNEASGDGYKYRGFGFIQLTGKTNQTDFFKAINLDPNTNPSLIATQYPLLSAAWFFNKSGLNAVADLGFDETTIEKVTKIVNGGEIGLPQRIIEFNKFYPILSRG